MLLATAQLLAAVGGVAFVVGLAGYRYHNETGLFAALSLGAWTALAFGADDIVLVTETGATVARSEPTLLWISVGLAAVSALAVVGSLSGKWPQETNR